MTLQERCSAVPLLGCVLSGLLSLGSQWLSFVTPQPGFWIVSLLYPFGPAKIHLEDQVGCERGTWSYTSAPVSRQAAFPLLSLLASDGERLARWLVRNTELP